MSQIVIDQVVSDTDLFRLERIGYMAARKPLLLGEPISLEGPLEQQRAELIAYARGNPATMFVIRDGSLPIGLVALMSCDGNAEPKIPAGIAFVKPKYSQEEILYAVHQMISIHYRQLHG